MVLFACPECGAQVSSTAPACPHCGSPIAASGAPAAAAPPPKRKRRPFTAFLLVILFLIVVGAVIASNDKGTAKNGDHDNDTTQPAASQATGQTEPAPAPAPPPGPAMPTEETTFINVVEQGAHDFNAAPNDLLAGATRPQRAKAICALGLHGSVSNWIGTIDELSSNNDGKGVLSIRLAPHLTFQTTNNDLSDGLSELKTLIDPNSTMFKILSGMSTGQRVVFSGNLEYSENDCYTELSLTKEGAMTDPQFLMQFTALAPVQ